MKATKLPGCLHLWEVLQLRQDREIFMKQQISVREANQHLSRYIEAVEKGHEFVITKRGKPVAKLVRVFEERKLTPEQEAALKALFSLKIKTGGSMYTREEIYGERMAELEARRNRKR
jgi:prevent-host-death family protein